MPKIDLTRWICAKCKKMDDVVLNGRSQEIEDIKIFKSINQDNDLLGEGTLCNDCKEKLIEKINYLVEDYCM